MNGYGRKRKCRNIHLNHSEICFKPCGIKASSIENIIIFEDEMEAIRLADFHGEYQQECADMMNISRSTFSRMVVSARKKIADALLHQKAIRIVKRKNEKSLKIAVPVNNDKINICQRTGQAAYFAIYEDGIFVKSIKNEHHPKKDDTSKIKHYKNIEQLKDCDVILLNNVGIHVKNTLENINIKIQKVTKKDGLKAQELVNKYISQTLTNQ